MIQVADLHRRFAANTVLDGVSFEVAPGRLAALIGGSGSGKSVLLKHLAGLLTPDRGQVLIDGKDLHGLKGRELTRMRGRMGFLFQGGALFDSMTVFDNVAFPLRERTRLSEEQIDTRVRSGLRQVGLEGAEAKYPGQLSGGMVKRAGLARALVTGPEIMLFDEPTTGLDPVIGRAILELIHAIHQQLKFTGVIVTHEIPRVFRIVDHVLLLKDGAIYAAGPPVEFMTSQDPYVRAFVDPADGDSEMGAARGGGTAQNPEDRR